MAILERQISEYINVLAAEKIITLEEASHISANTQEPIAINANCFLSAEEIEHIESMGNPLLTSENDHVLKIRKKIREISISEVLQYAIFGDEISRYLCATHDDPRIQVAVLLNKNLTEDEVALFACHPLASAKLLKEINKNINWIKRYSVKLGLVKNPKTPGFIAVKWLSYLRNSDLQMISQSSQIPKLISTTAKKRLENIEKTRTR